MRPDLSRLRSKLHDAGLAANAWPEALQPCNLVENDVGGARDADGIRQGSDHIKTGEG
jgi:hypothetical protein